MAEQQQQRESASSTAAAGADQFRHQVSEPQAELLDAQQLRTYADRADRVLRVWEPPGPAGRARPFVHWQARLCEKAEVEAAQRRQLASELQAELPEGERLPELAGFAAASPTEGRTEANGLEGPLAPSFSSGGNRASSGR